MNAPLQVFHALASHIDLPFMYALVGGQLAVQLACVELYRRQLAREAAAPAGPLPDAAVVVPCKGRNPGSAGDNIRSLLAQDYPGRLEFVFVVPSREDAAYGEVSAAIAGDLRARLLVSGSVPSRSSGKAVDLVYAVDRVSEGARVLVFGDAGILVTPDWARRLAAALEEPGVTVSSALMTDVPVQPTLCSLLRMTWTLGGAPFYRLAPVAYGFSMALRADDYRRLDVRSHWERCVAEDGALSLLARRAGGTVRFVAGVLPVSRESWDWTELMRAFNRYFIYGRHYTPAAWASLAVPILGKTWVLVWAARSRAWGLGAGALAADMLFFAALLAVVDARHGERFAGVAPRWRRWRLWGALTAPLLLPLYLVNLLVSAVSDRVRWGAYHYVIRGPFDVEVRPVVSGRTGGPTGP